MNQINGASNENRVVEFYDNLGASWLQRCALGYGNDISLIEYILPPGDVTYGDNATGLFAIHLALEGAIKLRRFVNGSWEEAKISPGEVTLSPPGYWTKAEWEGPQRRFSLYLSRGQLGVFAGLRASEIVGTDFDGDIAMGGQPLVSTMKALYAVAADKWHGGRERAIKSVISAICIDMVYKHSSKRLTSFELGRGGLAQWQVRRTTEYLNAHLDEEVSLATLAALVDLSPFHFARGFKRSVGIPPRAYLNVSRLNEAKRLLIETDQSITHIALSVGYEAPQTLARLFRRELGTTPTLYRREQRR